MLPSSLPRRWYLRHLFYASLTLLLNQAARNAEAALIAVLIVAPIHDAIQKGDTEGAKKLIADDPKCINARLDSDSSTGGISAVGLAASLGRIEIARLLLAAGADPNLSKQDGVSPLLEATKRADLPMMQLLLEHGAKVDATTNDGTTPLLALLAALSTETKGTPDMVRLLLDRKADLHAARNDGISALHLALAIYLKADKADSDARSSQASAAEAVLAAVPLRLALVRTPLNAAFQQLFASVKLSAKIDSALTAPMTLTADGPLNVVMDSLTRLARRSGHPVTVTVNGSTIEVRTAEGAKQSTVAESGPVFTSDPRFRFFRTISPTVLNNYLARAVTHYGLLSTSPEIVTPYFADDLRMLRSIGAKFIGLTAFAWVPPDDDEAHFRQATSAATRVHAADPEMILQAAVFEAVYQRVEKIPIPDWVFTEFGLPVEKRCFRYEAMLYDGGKYRAHWAPDASVPDMTKRETRMYFYYRARRYIDAGCEAIRFGQVHLMDQADPGHRYWEEMLTRIRRYASRNARRQIVLCDAHTNGVVLSGGRLLFDYHAFPLIVKNVSGSPMQVVLEQGYYNSIYGRSKGGTTPSGWSCTHAPYICDIDSGGASDRPGQDVGFPWIWGYDGICWFAHLSEQERNDFLRYAHGWLRSRQENGYLQPPTRRQLAIGVNGSDWYQANRKSEACVIGANQEETIRSLFGR